MGPAPVGPPLPLRSFLMPSSSLEPLTVAAITLSSLFYTLIWHHPALWQRVSASVGLRPTRAMALVAHALKILQLGLCAALLLAQPPGGASLYSQAFTNSLKNVLPGLSLVALGQHLNLCVYALLGEDGVYYGKRLGIPTPWVTEYPYSHVRDPQYVGALLTLAGAYLLRCLGAYTCVGWGLNYAYLMVLESDLLTPAPPPRARKARHA